MNRFVAFVFIALLVLPSFATETGFAPLLADHPDPKLAKKLATFGQFVGSWKWNGVQYRDDGTRTTDKGELHVHWILQGEAIQDVWIETETSDGGPKTLGTTLRFYDPKTDTWKCTWIHPRFTTVKTLIGRKSGDDIVLDGTNDAGEKFHWIFSEIAADSFRWHAEHLVAGTWRTTEDLRMRRTQKE